MTLDEALNMPAGSEVDALIAEQVMGWRKADIAGQSIWANKEGAICGFVYLGGDIDNTDFAPSEVIQDAWRVVEKLKESSRNLHLIEYAYDRTYATFNNDWENDDVYVEVNGKNSVPLAICRAALLAVMEAE